MKTAEIVLKLIFDKLKISPEIKTLADRKRVQKTIYLAQSTGVDIGYCFGWYLSGPYSPELMEKCHSLNGNLHLNNREYEKYCLCDDISSKIDAIKDIMTPPADIILQQEEWLELLASIAFLFTEKNYTKEQAIKYMGPEKEQLLIHFDVGLIVLKNHGLINSF
jgi:uncharacterized protein YwgA